MAEAPAFSTVLLPQPAATSPATAIPASTTLRRPIGATPS